VNTATTQQHCWKRLKRTYVINRITETYGMFRHTAQKSRNIAACVMIMVELMMSTGHALHMTPAQQYFRRRAPASAIACVGWNSPARR